jgi:signal transduction histidine kinase
MTDQRHPGVRGRWRGLVRRLAPPLIAGLLAALLGGYIVYTQRVVAELRLEAQRTGQMFARVYSALADPSEDVANDALLDLSRHITEMKVPVIVTDAQGRPTARANLPFEARLDDPRVREHVAVLDRQNAPVVEPGVGTVHFGHTPLVSGLRVIPLAQAAIVLLVVAAGAWALRVRADAERERVWAGMARESAHQLGTPLSSLAGWIELLGERDPDPAMASALSHMTADYERLERVAHRFERIGRPPRREPVDVGGVVERIAAYFRARVPSRANAVQIAASRPEEPVYVQGDQVLLEWALESLVRNAVDALAGRGGRVYLTVARMVDGRVRVRVADDGPGVPRELRQRVFDAGFTTKSSGWGIGLPLTRRIVEDWHGGRLVLVPVERGATFDIILQA